MDFAVCSALQLLFTGWRYLAVDAVCISLQLLKSVRSLFGQHDYYYYDTPSNE